MVFPIALLGAGSDDAVDKKLEDEAEQDDGYIIEDDELDTPLSICFDSRASATSMQRQLEEGSADFGPEVGDLLALGLEHPPSSSSSMATSFEQQQPMSGIAHDTPGSAKPACSDDNDEMLCDDSEDELGPYPDVPNYLPDANDSPSSLTSHYQLATPDIPTSSIPDQQCQMREPLCNYTDLSESLELDA